jgi:enterochelin esterase-like enzyme
MTRSFDGSTPDLSGKTAKCIALFMLLTAFFSAPAQAAGTLNGPIRISSTTLGYDLQYWIYLPDSERKSLPELYITDGEGYLQHGKLVAVLDREIAAGNIEPIAAIFVDGRDPDQLSKTRRNDQFMCNVDYGKFFIGELMPEISARWTGAGPATRRGLMGVSFGAVNSACFGIMMPGVFQLLIMHSPGSDRHIEAVRKLYLDKPRHSSAFFLSHGGRLDNETAARQFVQTLELKGYTVRHLSNNGRHDWKSWRPLMDESLRAFAGLGEGDRVDAPAEDPAKD